MSIMKYISEIEKGYEFWIAVGNFLDRFYSFEDLDNSIEEMNNILSQVPKKNDKVDIKYYYLIAAIVEQLCLYYCLEYPDWIFQDEFITDIPTYFRFSEDRKDDVYLFLTSPSVFCERNLFVPEDIMNRF